MSTNSRIHPYENEIVEGDSLHILKQLDSDSIDCIVTDPPYALTSEEYKPDKKYRGGFMNKEWDAQLVSVDIWKECLRVLKAGAFAFIMCTPRQDILARQIVNLQDAGFKTNFTSLYHTFASGFPKAANTTKLLEKRGIKKPELKGSYLGLQPKPAVEIILCVQKPLSQKSFVDQALDNGKGVTWLDDCRIPFQNEHDKEVLRRNCEDHTSKQQMFFNTLKNPDFAIPNDKGRFPANLIVSDDALNDGKITKDTAHVRVKSNHVFMGKRTYSNAVSKDDVMGGFNDSGSYSRYFDLDKWYSEQEAQFIITPKASQAEKNKGITNRETKKVNDGRKTEIDNPFQRGETLRHNTHPTIKPIKLMSYLITLGSRPNDIILDPFIGSGTTAIAALQLGRRFIGIEKCREYVEIARKRIESYKAQTNLLSFYS